MPWARYPDDGLDNLVIAHDRCNAAKSDSLAASEHVARWAARLDAGSPSGQRLADIAATRRWEQHPARTLGVARAIYLGLPDDARLWRRGKEFVGVDRDTLTRVLATA